ncbi:MAG TPA: tetratricopeptide repeat protein [Pyrinomonadaceae bacterium]|jgi:TonB family protein
MNKLILAAFVCLLPPALHAQATGATPVAAVAIQDKPASSPPAESPEADKLSASVMQLYAAGKYREALPLAERVLALREKTGAEEDASVGNALSNLAVLYLALKEFGRAEPLLERVLARREKVRAATSPTTSQLLMSYACLMSAKGVGKRDAVSKLVERINVILFQDTVLAAGLSLPANLSELTGGKVISKPRPHYSGEALNMRLQGTVLVLVETDETGKVVNAEPLPCREGQRLLADASVAAALEARFEPASINGKPIKLKSITTYNFVVR